VLPDLVDSSADWILQRDSVRRNLTHEENKKRRLRERIALSLPVRVTCRESIDHDWVDMSHLVDLTPFGARLRLKRPTEVGRLLQLTLNMPRQLRCFDYAEDQYRIWALVRNLRALNPQTEKGAVLEVGVQAMGAVHLLTGGPLTYGLRNVGGVLEWWIALGSGSGYWNGSRCRADLGRRSLITRGRSAHHVTNTFAADEAVTRAA